MTKKILITVSALAIGGTERVLLNLINQLPKNYEIDVLTFFDIHTMAKELPSHVNLTSIWHTDSSVIGKKEMLKMAWHLHSIKSAKKLYQKTVFKNYDVEICFSEWGMTPSFIAASTSTTSKKVCWIHFDAQIKDYTYKGLYPFGKILNRYDRINCVSQTAQQGLLTTFPMIKKHKTAVVYNPDNPREVVVKAGLENPFEKQDYMGVNILFVGRLVNQKGVDRLLEAHEKLSSKYSDYTLHIVGSGSEEATLKTYAKNHKLENIVWWGQQQNPYPFMKFANLIVMPSRFEGLPTVMIEALHLKTPLIITEVSGAMEIAQGASNVWVVDNSQSAFERQWEQWLANKNYFQEVINFDYNWQESVAQFINYIEQ